MAKKESKKSDQKRDQRRNRRRKKSGGGCGKCCCTCCIVVLVVVLIASVVGGLLVDGWLRSNIDAGLFECFDTIGSLLTSDEDKIISDKNRWSQKDENEIFDSLNRSLYLLPGTINKDKLLEILEGVTSSDAVASARFADDDDDAPDPTDPADPDDSGDSDFMLDILTDVLKYENFDIDRLRQFDYQSSQTEDFFVSITDKGFAALLNSLLASLIENMLPKDQAEIGQILGAVTLPQLTIRSVSVNDEQGQPSLVTVITATAALDFDVIGDYVYDQVIAANLGLSWLGFSRVLFDALTPDSLFLTIEMPFNSDLVPTRVGINNLTTDKFDRTANMVSGIGKVLGADIDLNKIIKESVTDNIVGALEQVTDYIDLTKFDNDGRMKLDLFGSVLGMFVDSDDPLETRDLMLMLKGTMASELATDVQSDEWNPFLDMYTDPDDPTALVYAPDPVVAAELGQMHSYKDDFVNELASKYALDLKVGTDEEVTFDDLMAMFGIGTTSNSSIDDLVSMFDTELLKQKLGEDIDTLDVNITDRMMAAIIDSMFADLVGEDQSLADMNMQLEQLILQTETIGGTPHNFVVMTVSLQVDALLGAGGDNAMIDLVGGLVLEKMYLTMRIDITLETDAFAVADRVETQMRVNGLSYDDTDIIFDVLAKIGASVDRESISSQISDQLNSLLTIMADIINITLADSKITMPNLFDTMASQMFDDQVTGLEVKDVLDAMFRYDGENKEDYVQIADNLDAFYGDLADNFYMLNTDGMDVADLMNGSFLQNFDKDNFRTLGVDGLFYDQRDASELTVQLTDSELAYFMMTQMGDDDSMGNLIDILSLDIQRVLVEGTVDEFETVIVMSICIQTDTLFNDAGTAGQDNQFTNLFDANFIILQATTYLDRVFAYSGDLVWKPDADFGQTIADKPAGYTEFADTSITINDMTEAQLNAFQTMITRMAGAGMFDINTRARDIGRTLHEQFDKLGNQISGGITFVDGGIQLPSFYQLLATMLNLDNTGNKYGDDDDEFFNNLKGAIQGLYCDTYEIQVDDGTGGTQPQAVNSGNPNNFSMDYFQLNPIADAPADGGTLTDEVAGDVTDIIADIMANIFGSPDLTRAGKTKIFDYTFEAEIQGGTVDYSVILTTSDSVYGRQIFDAIPATTGELIQFNLVSANPTADADIETHYQDIFDFTDEYQALDRAKDYGIATIQTNFTAGASTGVGAWLPDDIYMSAILDLTSDADLLGAEPDNWVRINTLTPHQQAIIVDLMGIDEQDMINKLDDVLRNVRGIITDCQPLTTGDLTTRQYPNPDYDPLYPGDEPEFVVAPWNGYGKLSYDMYAFASNGGGTPGSP